MSDGYEDFFDEMNGDLDMDAENCEDDSMLPCVNLTDIFDLLADTPVLPVANQCFTGRPGWTYDALGGDGLCLGEAFNMSTAEGSP